MSDGYMSVIKYDEGKSKVERTYETGYYEALYSKGDDFILESKSATGTTKKLRIPSNVIFDLAELIPALMYFEKNLMGDIVLLDGTEVVKIRRKNEL
jgi:hypothetical protein